MNKNKFAIGTTNEGKIREIGAILSATVCELEVCTTVNPKEIHHNFVDNAILKAVAYAKVTGLPTISEDSGLVIPALCGLPGPWSARFSDCEFDWQSGKLVREIPTDRMRAEIDLANNLLVLEKMREISQPYRVAKFVVSLIVANPSGDILFKGLGESHGFISQEMRGNNGFGYDPIFVGEDTFGKTYAELDSHRKSLKSHRRKVLNEFQGWLGKFLREAE